LSSIVYLSRNDGLVDLRLPDFRLWNRIWLSTEDWDVWSVTELFLSFSFNGLEFLKALAYNATIWFEAEIMSL
jgi:hypothetical protein